MSLPLISFFLSLVGIIVMISRELVLVRNGQVATTHHSHPFVSELQKMKYITYKGTKKFIYVLLFIVIKFFIKTSNYIKTEGLLLFQVLKNKITKNKPGIETEKKEVSKYLKVISEYRHKIRQIKHRIKEEEGIE